MFARPTIQNHKHLVHALLVCIGLLLLVSGIAIGLIIRQFTAEAAPANVSACVNKYTGAVRMSPNGVTTCNANESPVSWSAVDTDTHGVGETINAPVRSDHPSTRSA